MNSNEQAVKQYIQAKAIEQEQQRAQKRLQSGIKVFISYSSVDSKVATKISSILGRLEIDHFFDKKDIEWGQQLTAVISEQLKGSSHLVVIISPASMKSHWVSYEIGQAVALGKVILPFLTHPSIDPPDFITQFHYKTRLSELKEFFARPSVDEEELNRIHRIIASRLPDLSEYTYCRDESTIDKDVWRSASKKRAVGLAEDGYGRIVIEGVGSNQRLSIVRYRGGGVLDLMQDTSSLTFSGNTISVNDRTISFDIDGKMRSYDNFWSASAAFWEALVAKLRSSLPSRRNQDTHTANDEDL